MDIELSCECGRDSCTEEVHIRRGYVHIQHADGIEEERWDYCYVNVYGLKEGDIYPEVMLTPSSARKLMWNLILGYMPVVSTLVHKVRLWYYQFNLWRIFRR
jgi:hypothetical protein